MSRKKSDTLNVGISMDEEALLGFKKGNKPEKSKEGFDVKIAAFVSIGALSFVYVIGELGVAIWLNSLVLLSDGFHNLSDVVSLYIAYWAQNAQKRDSSHDMSYGWARTEILGGLTNGCFLLSLCLYVVLESIPKFIRPEPIEGGFWFMITAGIGLAVNTIGTIVFCITGQAHGHSHSHGHGHGHGHGHEHKDKSKKEKKDHKEDKHKEEKMSLLDSDGIEEVEIKKEKKKKENGHGHSHSHSHKEGKDKEGKKKEGHEHGHSHGHKDKKKKKKRDMNVHAVFLHFLGDAISSVMVLIAGALIHFFDGAWVLYIDAVSSLLIVGIILWTTIPLVKRCSMILLQSTPNDLDVEAVRIKLLKVTGVVSLHDFHVWQLIDGMVITSLHVGVEEGADFSHVITDIKKVLHEYGIHSTSVQPEFVPRSNRPADFCEQNCVKECEEDWCCKKPSERKRILLDEYATSTEL